MYFLKGEPAENSTLTIQFFFSADSASRFGFWHLEVVLEPKNSFVFSHGFKKNAATFFLQLGGFLFGILKGYFFLGFFFGCFSKALKGWIELNWSS